MVPDNQRLFIISFERIRQIKIVDNDAISFVPYHHHPQKFSRFSKRDEVLHVIYDQVKNTGMSLEKSMAPVVGAMTGENSEQEVTSLKSTRETRIWAPHFPCNLQKFCFESVSWAFGIIMYIGDIGCMDNTNIQSLMCTCKFCLLAYPLQFTEIMYSYFLVVLNPLTINFALTDRNLL